jgi:hypothetical protein
VGGELALHRKSFRKTIECPIDRGERGDLARKTFIGKPHSGPIAAAIPDTCRTGRSPLGITRTAITIVTITKRGMPHFSNQYSPSAWTSLTFLSVSADCLLCVGVRFTDTATEILQPPSPIRAVINIRAFDVTFGTTHVPGVAGSEVLSALVKTVRIKPRRILPPRLQPPTRLPSRLAGAAVVGL